MNYWQWGDPVDDCDAFQLLQKFMMWVGIDRDHINTRIDQYR